MWARRTAAGSLRFDNRWTLSCANGHAMANIDQQLGLGFSLSNLLIEPPHFADKGSAVVIRDWRRPGRSPASQFFEPPLLGLRRANEHAGCPIPPSFPPSRSPS